MSKLMFAALLSVCSMWAQYAAVTGRITDSSGAVVQGAAISIQSASTGIRVSVVSNDEGYYTVPQLQPGTYNLEIMKAGFRQVSESHLHLDVEQVARIDRALEVGGAAQAIDVKAQAVALDSETATLGQVLQSRQITELPLLGRNPYALAMLADGVRPASQFDNLPVNQISQSAVSINGQRGSANEYLLDGAPNSAPSQNQPVIFPSVDAVEEFKVETNSFSAAYGRASGGVFNVVTKSGTNGLHFNLFEFLRNRDLNANDWFANRAGTGRPPFVFNQFGGTAGGPVMIPKLYNGKNKTFFFGSTELVRYIQGVTFNDTVPTVAQRAGDFSQTRNAAGALIQIYDPTSTQLTGSTYTRQLFPGNQIPLSRIDPVARNVLPYWALPNSAGQPFTNANNFFRTDANHIQKNTFSARIDHYFSQSDRLFGRVSYDNTPNISGLIFGQSDPASPNIGPQVFMRRNGVVEETHTFSPSLIGTLRFSGTRLVNDRGIPAFDITSLGFPANLHNEILPQLFPVFSVTGEAQLGNTGLIDLANNVYAWQAEAMKSLSKHTLRAGFDFRVIQFNNYQPAGTTTQFTFAPSWTQGPNAAQSSATAGYGLASFLLGAAGGSQTLTPAVAQETKYYAAFLQDDYKVTSRLTVNLGIRYEYESPRTDRFNQLTNFDFGATPPLKTNLNLRGALSYVGVNGVSSFQSNPDRNNLSPRVGVAFKLTSNTVIRAGGGIFYDTNTGIGTTTDSFGLSGFSATTSIVTSQDGVTPNTFLRNPYPNGIVQPTGSSLGSATLLGQAVAFYDRSNRTPYSGQWNINIQRLLPGNALLEAGYSGSRGLKLYANRQLNQLPDADLALGNNLRTQVPNPFYGQITNGILSAPTIAMAQLLRPFPQFDTVTSDLGNWGSSTYNALLVKVEKRYSRGFTFLASYTYSKLMDNSTGAFAGETLSGGASTQDWNNLKSEWAPSTIDQTQRIVMSGVWEVPLAKTWKGAPGMLFHGWQLGAIASFLAGGPLGIVSNVNNTDSQGGGQRPNWTGVSAGIGNPTVSRWFDTSQFSNPPAYAFGNVARTLSDLRSNGVKNIDLTLSKNFLITEKFNLQFRAEAFNLTNKEQFAPPGTSLGSPLFGVVSASQNNPRIVQLGLKLTY
jgi:hypothetical protein